MIVASALLIALSGPAATEPLLVSTAWLSRHLHDPRLVILHVGEKAGYEAAHIPGARYLAPVVELSTPRVEGQLFLELPSRAVLDSVLSAKGISNDSRVVLCPADGYGYFTAAARALFTLEYAGLRGRVSILDGGFEAWKREGLPVTRDVPPIAAGRFTTRPDSSLVVEAEFVHARLTDPRVRIVDARDSSYYNGRETRQGRNGHIPGAASIPFLTITDSTGRFRPVSRLRAQFAQAGVRPGQTVVTYCHIGQQASLVWFAARLLGYPARLYDGSFQDWARRTDLPVEP
jgi:thiosulfate/3-mercaptopyruvate sulfurtransferase